MVDYLCDNNELPNLMGKKKDPIKKKFVPCVQWNSHLGQKCHQLNATVKFGYKLKRMSNKKGCFQDLSMCTLMCNFNE